MKLKPLGDIKIKRGITANELVKELHLSGGFTAKKLGQGVNILESMFKDRECIKFLSFPGCIVATGTRGVICDMLKKRMADVIITTCGTLDHDLARIWKDYYHGSFTTDDSELHREGINRLGNVFIPNESYGIVLEKKMQPVLEELWESGKRELTTKGIVREFGRWLDENKVKNREDSIIYWAYKNEIPIYVPGITDGAFGSQIWMFSQDHDFKIDILGDEKELASLVFDAKKTGALMIGGGISKHHVIWWNQFRDGLDYAVYITTAVEYDGSLSGARVREGISWGKVAENAKYVTIEGDATVLLPLMFGALVERL